MKGKSSCRADATGSALIVTIGILLLLTTLALVFIQVSSREGELVDAHSNQVRARMLAQSGFQDVMTEPDSPRRGPPNYRGEDWNNSGDNTSLPDEYGGDDENYNGDNQVFSRDIHPRWALRPSYFVRGDTDYTGDGRREPDLVAINPRDPERDEVYRGYTGRLPASAGGTDTYSVRVRDNSQKININSLNDRLANVLNHVAEEVGLSDDLGTTIFENRPEPVELSHDPGNAGGNKLHITGGYPSIQYLRNEGILSEGEFEEIRPYIITHHRTFVDKSTIKPSPQNVDDQGRLIFPDEETGRPRYDGVNTVSWWNETGVQESGYGPFHYDFSYRLQPRAPINVNLASEHILFGLIEDLEANATVYDGANAENRDVLFNGQYGTEIIDIEESQVQEVVEEILAFRRGETSIDFQNREKQGPFRSWPQFEAFVHQKLVENGSLSRSQGYLLIANFHPSTRFGKFNWDPEGMWNWVDPEEPSRYYTLDKTDFTEHTTEFIFNSAGWKNVVSYGRVTDDNDRIIAEATLEATVRTHNVIRHTSQRDFFVNADREATSGINFFPEPIANTGAGPVEEGNQVLSNFSGQLAFIPGTKTNGDLDWGAPAEGNGDVFEFRYWEPDQGLDLNTDKDDHLPYAWFTREFNDVQVDNTPEPAGLGASDRYNESNGLDLGRYASEEHPPSYQAGVDSDPANYAQITPDGMLSTSQRYRAQRVKTGNSAWEDWEQGHMEFWWKPRQDFGQISTEVILAQNWFLAEHPNSGTGLNTHIVYYDNAEWDGAAGEVIFEEGAEPEFLNWVEPRDSEAFLLNSYDLGSAAGLEISLRYIHVPNESNLSEDQDNFSNGYYLVLNWIHYFDDMGGAVWVGQERDDMDPALRSTSPPFMTSTEYIHLPVTDGVDDERQMPEPNEWNKIVANWSPKVSQFDYLEWNEETEQMSGVPRTIQHMTGNVWANGSNSGQIQETYAGQVENGSVQVGPALALENQTNFLTLYTIVYSFMPSVTEYHNRGHFGSRLEKRLGDTEYGEHPVDQMVLDENMDMDRLANDRFPEGTIDGVFVSTNPSSASSGTGTNARRYPLNVDGYVGQVRRSEHSYWGGDSEAFNGYAKVDQRTFQAEMDERIEIIEMQHTQYQPRETYDGETSSLPPSERPQFEVSVESGGTEYGPAQVDGETWGGTVREVSALFESLQDDRPLVVPPQESFRYQLTPENIEQTNGRVTPHFDEMTIYYRTEDLPAIRRLFYRD